MFASLSCAQDDDTTELRTGISDEWIMIRASTLTFDLGSDALSNGHQSLPGRSDLFFFEHSCYYVWFVEEIANVIRDVLYPVHWRCLP